MSPQKLTMSIRASLRSRHTKLHGDFEYFPHTSNNALPSKHPAKPFRLKHPTSLNTTSLAAPRTNHIQSCKKRTFVDVLLKQSFVIHSCALKLIVLNKITISLHRYNLICYIFFQIPKILLKTTIFKGIYIPYRIHIFSSLKISNENILKNILEI